MYPVRVRSTYRVHTEHPYLYPSIPIHTQSYLSSSCILCIARSNGVLPASPGVFSCQPSSAPCPSILPLQIIDAVPLTTAPQACWPVPFFLPTITKSLSIPVARTSGHFPSLVLDSPLGALRKTPTSFQSPPAAECMHLGMSRHTSSGQETSSSCCSTLLVCFTNAHLSLVNHASSALHPLR
jgi:hypothetical protein